jgi:hypothetical protein
MRTLPPAKKKPVASSAKTSGACGASTSSGVFGFSDAFAMNNSTPGVRNEIWHSKDRGVSWRLLEESK